MAIAVVGPLLLLCALVAAVVAALFLVLVVRVARGARSRGLGDEEADLLRQLNEGLQKMEERVSNLETILMSRTRAPKP